MPVKVYLNLFGFGNYSVATINEEDGSNRHVFKVSSIVPNQALA